MSKAIQALLTGMFFTFFIDFFVFLGLKKNYIDYYEIDLYYNILFADHQNAYLFFGVSVILGYIVIYINNNKLSIFTVGFLSLIALSTLTHSVGNTLGEMMFMKKNKILRDSKYSYHGDIYYDGRKKITFYDYEIKKILILDKKELK